MKTKLLFAVLISWSCVVRSQVLYSFAKASATYAHLSGATTVTSFDPNTGLYMINDLQGETFKVFGKDFTFGGTHTIAMGEYPFLRIDDDSTSILADGVFTWLDTIDATTNKSYKVEGTPADYILKLEYRNFKIRNGPVGNFMSVQIWLHQKTGVIEIHFGPRSSNNANGYSSTTGPSTGIFYSPDDFTSCYSKLWCFGLPTNLMLDSAATLVFKGMGGIPVEGTVYRFLPRFMPVSTVGIKDQTVQDELKVFPSPVATEVIISGKGIRQFAITDLRGIVVMRSETEKDEARINVEDFEPGMYFLKVTREDGSETLKKINIVH